MNYKGPKIKVQNPIVDIEGDEMAQIMWKDIRQNLIFPYLDLKTMVFDLSIVNRDITDDVVTFDCAEAIKACNVGIKCATITPDENRVKGNL